MPDTVNAVVTLTVEIPVRSSSPNETLAQLKEAAEKEAGRIIDNDLPPRWRAVGTPQFIYATVRTNP